MSESTPQWYIVQTYVGFEDAVKKSLELKISNLNLQEKILEIYIPTKTIIKLNKKGEKQEKQEKVYAGYIAGTGDVAVPLEDGYVEKLKENLQESKEKTQNPDVEQKFNIGDLIEVTQEPFKGMTGKVVATYAKESKIDVVLTMFDRDTVVTLDIWEVKKNI